MLSASLTRTALIYPNPGEIVQQDRRTALDEINLDYQSTAQGSLEDRSPQASDRAALYFHEVAGDQTLLRRYSGPGRDQSADLGQVTPQFLLFHNWQRPHDRGCKGCDALLRVSQHE